MMEWTWGLTMLSIFGVVLNNHQDRRWFLYLDRDQQPVGGGGVWQGDSGAGHDVSGVSGAVAAWVVEVAA